MKRDLIDITDLSVAEIDELIAKAEDIIEHPEEYRDKKVAFTGIIEEGNILKIASRLVVKVSHCIRTLVCPEEYLVLLVLD